MTVHRTHLPNRPRHVARRLLATAVAVSLAAQAPAQAAQATRHDAAPHAAAPQAVRTSQPHDLLLPRTARSTADFMTMVLRDVHGFWTQTLTESGAAAPKARYYWFTRKRVRTGGCGPATRNNPFYCARDDTIYISQQFARKVWNGRVRGPGGRTIGDMGLAAVIAHEYAHNVQTELGVYRAHRTARHVMPFELEADCMSGIWAHHAYHEGVLEAGDVEEAAATSAAVGDYEVDNPQHHGTPAERRTAWMLGYNTGDLAQCGGYVANA